MRFRKIDLLAFGHFTETSIDLSAGQFGLHMIFGHNEAGKSSSLRAFTDLLYGIPARTSDSFLHSYNKMRIGGTLERTDGKTLECIRRKANQGTLRDRNDVAVIADSELQSFIGDVDREQFCSMFGIDHATLRRGGAELAQGGGQLGTILFSSASGLAGLREVQSNFVEKIDGVFKTSGRSGSLIDSINTYKGRKEKQKETQVSADTYNKHAQARQEAIAHRDDLNNQIYNMQLEKGRLERISNSLQAIAGWRTANSNLEAMGNVILLDENFAGQCSKLVADLQKYELQKKGKDEAIEEIDARLRELPDSSPILSLADRIEEIKVRLGEYRKGKIDFSRNETFLQQSEREARNILRTMGRSDDLTIVEALRVPADKIVRIQTLGIKLEGLEARAESSSAELAKLRRQIVSSQTKLNATLDSPKSSSLRSKIQQIQKQGDLELQAAKIRMACEALKSEIQIETQRLPLWKGTAETLVTLVTPSIETIERFENEWRDLEGEIKEVRKDKLDVEKELSALNHELAKLESNQLIPSHSLLVEKRTIRNEGWRLIRGEWIDGELDDQAKSEYVAKFSGASHLSNAFEQSIADADEISDQLRTDADRVANKARILLDLKQHDDQLQSVIMDLDKVQEKQRQLNEDWALQWQSLKIVPLPPREMRSWVLTLSSIIKRLSDLNSQRNECETLESKIVTCKSELRRELERVGVDVSSIMEMSLQEVLDLAQQKEDELQAIEHDRSILADAIEKAKIEAEEAEDLAEKAESALKNWRLEWGNEMEKIGLERNALPNQANDVLNSLEELFQKLHDADGFRKRTLGIDRDAKQFVADLQQIAVEISSDLTSLPVEKIIDYLTVTLEDARKKKTLRERLLEQRDADTSQLRDAEKNYCNLLDQVNECCKRANCVKYDDLQQAADLSRQYRSELTKRAIHEEQILKNAGNRSLEEFLAEVEVEAANPDCIPPLLEKLDRDIKHLFDARDEAIKSIEREANSIDALNKNDHVASLATECESISATIEDQFRELAVLRVCAAVLSEGIERFRKKNQDPLLMSAASHFRAMTCGAYSELRAELGEQSRAILVGIRASSGETVHVSQMSDGTCDQLYLSLRLASIESWLQRHEPIPFIVDDILLNFDNARAAATLERLVELSSRTQVIFFTHHRHLVQLAEQHLGSEELFVHELKSKS